MHATPASPLNSSQPPKSLGKKIAIALFALLLLYGLILSVGMVGSGFKLAAGGKKGAEAVFAFASNPVIGLIMGVFATALVQSSSTVTSVIVGMVAGGLDVGTAIPMIMGANIGTTVTNTLVSLAHITRPQEFRRAFAAATIHDFFNLLAVIIFLGAEIIVGLFHPEGKGLLQMITEPLATALYGSGEGGGGFNIKNLNFIKPATKPVIYLFYHAKDGEISGLYGGMNPIPAGISMAVTGLVLIFTSIYYLGKILKANLTGTAERIFHAALGRGPLTGITTGTVITVLVQSSSTTTSLIIPMAGAGALSLKQVYPFTLGANIGTTVTALLASLAGGKHGEAAVQIALVHTSFNLMATIVIYGTPFLRDIPLKGAEWIADMAVKRRSLAVSYILVVFFIIPLLIIGCMKLFESDAPAAAAPAPAIEATAPAADTTTTPEATSPTVAPAASPTEH